MNKDLNSLAEALHPEPPTLRIIDGTKYKWSRIWDGRKKIQEYHNQRTKLEDVRVEYDEHREVHYTCVPLGFGDTYISSIDGFLYSDNTIMVCCSIERWGGTFATHNDIRIDFYILTPNPEKVKTKKKKK